MLACVSDFQAYFEKGKNWGWRVGKRGVKNPAQSAFTGCISTWHRVSKSYIPAVAPIACQGPTGSILQRALDLCKEMHLSFSGIIPFYH